jgi:transposase
MKLKAKDRYKILDILDSSKDARVIRRANALNLRSKGWTIIEVADALEITSRTVINIETRYEEGGLNNALYDDPRPGQPPKIDDRVKSHVVALVCSEPPEGFDRWTLNLIQEKIIKDEIIDSISHESVRIILQEHDLKPWKQKSWCVPELTDEFKERMEDVLDIYEKPYDENKPVVCVDEKPIQLLDDVRPPSGIAPGEEKKSIMNIREKGLVMCFVL